MIGNNDGTYIIAETANTHEGKPDRLRRLIDAAAETGADAVKVHVYSVKERAVPESEAYVVNNNLSISRDDWRELLPYAQEKDLDVVADVFGRESVDLLDEIGVDAVKIHAADVNNRPLLEYISSLECPVSLYVGGVTSVEIAEALDVLRSSGATDLSLMYGLQNFPTSVEDTELHRIQALKSKFNLPTGYASHVDGGTWLATRVPGWAVAAGADAVETHITIGRERKWTDYHSSLSPDRFKEMVRNVRTIEVAAGTALLDLTDAELAYRDGVKKSLVATRDLEPGERITEDDVSYLRIDNPPSGEPLALEDVVGKKVENCIDKHTPIKPTNLNMNVAVVLACRSESTRLYGKPLQLVGGKPILHHILERIRKVEYVDDIVVAAANTPSQSSYADFADRHNLSFVVGSESDVLQRLIDAGRSVNADVVIRAMTENPFIYWQGLDDMIKRHINSNADLTVPRRLPLGSFVDIHSMRALERSHRHGNEKHRSEYTSLFILENPESFTILTQSTPDRFQRPDIRLTVDNPEDLLFVREIYDRLPGDGDEPTSLSAIIDVIESEPSLLDINNQYVDGLDPTVKQARPFVYGDMTN